MSQTQLTSAQEAPVREPVARHGELVRVRHDLMDDSPETPAERKGWSSDSATAVGQVSLMTLRWGRRREDWRSFQTRTRPRRTGAPGQ